MKVEFSMELVIQQLQVEIEELGFLIEDENYEEVYNKYKKIDQSIKNEIDSSIEINDYARGIVADFYASYAHYLFSASMYENFFDMYLKAQSYGYSSEKRRSFLYEALVEPNLDDFRSNYTKNIDQLKAFMCIDNAFSFDKLSYWLLPTGNENEFYLYDKKSDLIEEKFRWSLSENSFQIDIDMNSTEFDRLIIGYNSCSDFLKYVENSSLNAKKTYFVDADCEKIFTCMQGGIVSEFYFKKITIFKNYSEFNKYFLKNNNYLPRKIIGLDEKVSEYKKIMGEIHDLRLKKERRHGDNVLLTIGIPSFNRGKKAYDNVIHTLMSCFDEEIEIVISNNGTQNETKNFYQKISLIGDARVTYFEFDENQGAAKNICKVIDLAKGKYVLMISDEDLVNLNELKRIMSILDMIIESNIGVIRTRTDGQGIVPYFGLAEPGKDALLRFMLTSNYMTGMIFNKEIVKKYKLLDYVRNNLDNETIFYYPHVVMELILCQYTCVLGLNIILVNEGQPEKTEAQYTEIGKEIKTMIPYYATLDGRLKQHKGFYEVIKELEISKCNFDMFRKLYLALCRKTLYLVSLSREVFYKETDDNGESVLKTAYNEILKYLDIIYYGRKSSNKFKFNEDYNELKAYYNNLKQSC